MALRVLLADESSSIKKVMQLALQDFGVEVKAVPVGVDVGPVCKSWLPDIVFVDVLLAKKSGYEVCGELKSDPSLRKLPVVLMWSGFMAIDEAKAKASRADQRLEKPFDADTLRAIVKDLVPATQENIISSYLSFPELPDFVDTPKQEPLIEASANASLAAEIDEPEDFTQIPLPKTRPEQRVMTPPPPPPIESENWQTGKLDRFKINIPKDDFNYGSMNLESLEEASIELAGGGQISLGDLEADADVQARSNPRIELPAKRAEPPPKAQPAAPSKIAVEPEVLEQVLREQARAVLQDIAWKIIPDIVERVVREELAKLMKEAEKLS